MTNPATPTPPPRHRMGRRTTVTLWIVGGVIAASVVYGLAGGKGPDDTAATATPPATATAAPSAPVHPSTAPPPRGPTATPKPVSNPPPTAPPADTLTGYGATIAAWDAHHRADGDYETGSAYDTDPALPAANGHPGAKYVAVQPLGGRVTDYMINLRLMPLADAERAVTSEFPADTRVLWTHPAGTCVQVEYSSPTLHAILGQTEPGDVQVEYSDLQPGGPVANPTTITQALVSNLPGAAPDPAATC